MGLEIPARVKGGIEKGVRDGDTFEAVVQLDKETAKKAGISKKEGEDWPITREWAGDTAVRNPDLDTHEIKTEKGKKERKWVVGWLREAVQKKNRGNDKPVSASAMGTDCDNSHGEDSGFYLTLYTPKETIPEGQYGRKLLHTYRDFDGDNLATSVLTRFGASVGWYD